MTYPEQRERTAFHEAGHAAMAYMLPRPLGHRILRLLGSRTDPGSRCRPAPAHVALS
jgi:hypothetical protein